MSPSVAQGQTKNSKFGADNADGHSQQQQHGMDVSADNRSVHQYGHQMHHSHQPSMQGEQPQPVETNFDVDGNVETETKSISSVKSTGSGGQEALR